MVFGADAQPRQSDVVAPRPLDPWNAGHAGQSGDRNPAGQFLGELRVEPNVIAVGIPTLHSATGYGPGCFPGSIIRLRLANPRLRLHGEQGHCEYSTP